MHNILTSCAKSSSISPGINPKHLNAERLPHPWRKRGAYRQKGSRMMKSIKRLFKIATFTSTLLLAGQCFAESEVAVISTPGPEAVDVNPLTRLVYVANF